MQETDGTTHNDRKYNKTWHTRRDSFNDTVVCSESTLHPLPYSYKYCQKFEKKYRAQLFLYITEPLKNLYMWPLNRKDSILGWEPQTLLDFQRICWNLTKNTERHWLHHFRTACYCWRIRALFALQDAPAHLTDAQSVLAASSTTDLIIQINMLILTETSGVNLRWRAENNEHYSLTLDAVYWLGTSAFFQCL